MALIMPFRSGMAGLTIGEAAVIEGCALPTAGAMASGTLTRIMIGGGNIGVATGAVGEACMVKDRIFPTISAVTSGTLTREMIFRGGVSVATGAVGEACVIEDGVFPARGVGVAGGTLAGKMVFGSSIRMATGAVGEACVVENGRFPPPIHRMTVTTIAWIMRFGCVIHMATDAIANTYMVKSVWFPVGDKMAIGAIALEMGFWWLVAFGAGGRCVSKRAIGVARFTSDVVTAVDGEEAVIHILQKGDGSGVDAVWVSILRLRAILSRGIGVGHGGVGVCAEPINGRFLQSV